MPTLDTGNLNVALTTLSLFICGFGLISYFVKHRLYISEALVACLFGIIIGPHVTAWTDPRQWSHEAFSESGASNHLIFSATRIAVGIQVLFSGIALPHRYVRIEARSLSTLIVGYMIPGWLISAFLIMELVQGLTYMEALCIAACITPTDPVLASSITKGRFAEEDVDPALRHLILAESGANDGLGYPFIYLPLYWFLAHSDEPFPVGRGLGGVVGRWFYDIWLYDIVLALVGAVAIGYAARVSLRFAEKRKWMDEDSFLAYGIGLAFLCLGVFGLIGSDDLLACFVAGVAFSWDDRQRQVHEDESLHDIIDTIVNAAVFVYIGASIPFELFNTGIVTVGRLIALAICILVFRRLPWVVLLHWVTPALRNWRHGVFVGWFGPMGVSAIFYLNLLMKELPESRHRLREVLEPVIYFIVLSSVIVHGVSIPAHKGIQRYWNQLEAKYFPKLWARHEAEKDERDAELRRAEEQSADAPASSEEQGQRV